MCVAKPVDVKVQPDILTKVYLPPSVIRTEQVEIVATVSNYLQETLEVRVIVCTLVHCLVSDR